MARTSNNSTVAGDHRSGMYQVIHGVSLASTSAVSSLVLLRVVRSRCPIAHTRQTTAIIHQSRTAADRFEHSSG